MHLQFPTFPLQHTAIEAAEAVPNQRAGVFKQSVYENGAECTTKQINTDASPPPEERQS